MRKVRPSIVIVYAPQAKHLGVQLHSCAVDSVVERCVSHRDDKRQSEYDVFLDYLQQVLPAQAEVWVLIPLVPATASLLSTCQALISVFSAQFEGAACLKLQRYVPLIMFPAVMLVSPMTARTLRVKAVRDQANTWCIEELIEFVEADCSTLCTRTLSEKSLRLLEFMNACRRLCGITFSQLQENRARWPTRKSRNEPPRWSGQIDAPGPGSRAPASSATAPAQDGPGINAGGVQHPTQLTWHPVLDLGTSSEDTEELVELISQAKQIREGSLNGSLSDEERFAQAENSHKVGGTVWLRRGSSK